MRHPVSGAPPLFEELDHTSDRGLLVRGTTPAELFEKGALALYASMVRPENVESRDETSLVVEAGSWEELFRDWLAELLSSFAVTGFIASEVVVRSIRATRVDAHLRGERFDEARHELLGEIKAITYHDLRVVQDSSGWSARVIVDV